MLGDRRIQEAIIQYGCSAVGSTLDDCERNRILDLPAFVLLGRACTLSDRPLYCIDNDAGTCVNSDLVCSRLQSGTELSNCDDSFSNWIHSTSIC